MKILRFLLSLSITVSLLFALNMKIGSVPPLGKFLDPFQGFWANAESEPDIPNLLAFDGLKQAVNIQYDDMLVPHIFAGNDDDLYFATGYVHAYHRLWQMEFQTHAAGGRLSEIVGEITLDMDRGMRRKGMVFGAENFIKNLDERSASIVQHYTDGVNAYINQLSYADYPLEYKLLDYKPEAWTPLKSGLLYKYMADMLNSHERDMENTNFRTIYGKDLLDLIYPDVDNYQAPVVNRTNSWDFEPIKKDSVSPVVIVDQVVSIDLLEKPNKNNGSNNWAVGPKKSANGHPMLCNDMHLSLYLPSLWFYMQQHTDELNVFGHSLPGIPFVITGFTDSIAWGFTNAQRDLVDWFKIEYENENRNNYLLDGKYIPTTKKIEEIKIRGEETYYDTVVYTYFGPVTYDHTYHADAQKNGYARRWIDHDPSSGFNMFYEINRAKNYDDYMNALDNFTSPAQNIAFASVQGDIAIRVQGKYPLNNFEEGKFIKDGTRSANNWTTYIPNRQNAFIKNPEWDYVSSANQQPTDASYPYYIMADLFESYRNRRINEVLNRDTSVTIDDLKNLQYDNLSLKASESLPWMLEQLHGIALTAIEMDMIEQLEAWDFYYTADSKQAIYFDIWFDKLYSGIWDEIKQSRDQNISLAYPSNYSTIRLMKTMPELDFFDQKSTDQKETAKDIAVFAFREMMTTLEKAKNEIDPLTWSNYKSTFVGHQLRIKPLGRYNLTTGGNGGDIVNATDKNHGPSERIIVELDPKGVKAWGHYPGGQSGNPGSKYYDNMIESWTNGSYYNLLFMTDKDKTIERIIFSQTLNSHK